MDTPFNQTNYTARWPMCGEGFVHRAPPAGRILANQVFALALPFLVIRPYLSLMTKLLEKALEAVRRLPPDSQDEIALAMLTLSGHEGEPEEIDPAHLPAVLEGLAQAKRRQFATDAEVEAAFRRFEQ
jgi:hypothetical protein